MLKAIIVDDETRAIKNLKWEIEKFCPDVEVIDHFTKPIEAISGINYLKPDCVFLDIEMPEIDGFQLLDQLSYRDFKLVITTAYDNYAINAFKKNAIDYLLKPIDSDDLKRAVSKIIKQRNEQGFHFELDKVIQSFTKQHHRKISIPLAGKIRYIEQDDIMYCKSDGNYTEIYLKDGSCEVITKNLKDVTDEILNEAFSRVHNSYSINIYHIKELVKSDGSYLIMNDGKNIPISRSKKSSLISLLEHKL